MSRPFTKMHGLGNDFVVFDATREPLSLSVEQMRWIADRRLGVGCDQILVVEPASDYDTDFRYRIYNADGSESAQCGNGARCFARYVREQGLTDKDRIVVETLTGRMVLEWLVDSRVRVEMGVPAFEPADIPLQASGRAPEYAVETDQGAARLQALAIGNPHAVLTVADVDRAPVATLGAALESHPRFPERVNVGFMQVVDPARIRLRVFERGVGETRACGSGACAAMVAGRRRGLFGDEVRVGLPGGDLVVSWRGPGEVVWLTGPAQYSFEGTVAL